MFVNVHLFTYFVHTQTVVHILIYTHTNIHKLVEEEREGEQLMHSCNECMIIIKLHSYAVHDLKFIYFFIKKTYCF